MTYSGQTYVSPQEALIHHGVLGQQWGIRRNRVYSTQTRQERKAIKKNYNAFARDSIEKKFGSEGATLFKQPISEAAYKKMSNKDEIIRKGQILSRVTNRKDETFRDATFVSSNKNDANLYRAVLPAQSLGVFGAGRRSYKSTYESTFKTLETLKSPSEKTRVDAFINLMDSKNIVLRNGKIVTGREFFKRGNTYKKEAKTLETQQLGLELYRTMATYQYQNSPLNTAYFKAIRDMGYNALSDDNDRGHLAQAPMILLNPNGTIKRMSLRQLTADEINQAQSRLKAPPKKR